MRIRRNYRVILMVLVALVFSASYFVVPPPPRLVIDRSGMGRYPHVEISSLGDCNLLRTAITAKFPKLIAAGRELSGWHGAVVKCRWSPETKPLNIVSDTELDRRLRLHLPMRRMVAGPPRYSLLHTRAGVELGVVAWQDGSVDDCTLVRTARGWRLLECKLHAVI